MEHREPFGRALREIFIKITIIPKIFKIKANFMLKNGGEKNEGNLNQD